MDGWPNYWPGLPPMHYATHCVGPVLGLTRSEAEYVSCFGSGTIREELQHHYGSTFRSEEHTSELQSLMRISYAVFCLKKKKQIKTYYKDTIKAHDKLTKTTITNNRIK